MKHVVVSTLYHGLKHEIMLSWHVFPLGEEYPPPKYPLGGYFEHTCFSYVCWYVQSVTKLSSPPQCELAGRGLERQAVPLNIWAALLGMVLPSHRYQSEIAWLDHWDMSHWDGGEGWGGGWSTQRISKLGVIRLRRKGWWIGLDIDIYIPGLRTGNSRIA